MRKKRIFSGILVVLLVPVIILSLRYYIDLRIMHGKADQMETEALNFHTGAQEAHLLLWLALTGLEISEHRAHSTPWLTVKLGVNNVLELERRIKSGTLLNVARKREATFCGYTDYSAHWQADETGTIREFYFYSRACWRDSL